MRPKYAIDEIERRWLVGEKEAKELLTSTPIKIIDKYLHGTRMRLRQVRSNGESVVFKLCKKYRNRQGPVESITNIYLDASEYQLLHRLPGITVEKLRFRQAPGAIDVYHRVTGDLFVYEIEFLSEAAARDYVAPAFVSEEVTGVERYSGFELAREPNL